MQRRHFLKTALTASGAASLAPSLAHAAESSDQPARELYELRRYQLRRGPKQKLFDDFFRKAAIPAMNRIGLGPIGVFSIATGQESPSMYVLIPHRSVESFLSATDRLLADEEYQKTGSEFLNAPATDPAYVRVESSLMVAFPGMPKLEVPSQTAEKKPRLFELRTYESHSKRANKKKIEMFDRGEIAIFRRSGLNPVFFGETLIGNKLPNLTYMLVYDDMAAHDRNWGVFIGDPDWKKLSSTPGYTDPEIVCNISNAFLRPASYSQI